MLDGLISSSFLQTNSSATQAAINLLVSGQDATALHNHDGVYAKLAGSNALSGNNTTTGSLYAIGTASQIGIGTNAPAGDLEIARSAPSIILRANSGSGQTSSITFDSGTTQRARIESPESSNTIRFLTGSQEGMRIDASQNVTVDGNLNLDKTLNLGRYNSTSEPALLLSMVSLGAAATGTVWFNTDSNQLKFWNGTTTIVLGDGTFVTSLSAGSGLISSGTATAPTLSVAYGSTAGTSIAGNAAFAGDVFGTYNNLSVVGIQGHWVSTSAPTSGQILKWNASTSMWEPSSLLGIGGTGGSVTSITAGSGLLGGTVTTVGTISVNQGSAPFLIVAENAQAQITQQNGSVVSPAFSFAASPSSGLYSPSVNKISLSTAGTAAMTIDALGRLGLGTTAPSAALEIVGLGSSSALILPRDTLLNRPAIGANGMIRYNTSASVLETFANGIWQQIASGSAVGTVQNIATGNGLLGGPISSVGTLIVDTGTGALKIVQQNSAAQITQNFGNASQPSFSFVGNTNSGLFSPAANSVALATAGTTALTVTANGSIGIGTNSPQAQLDIFALGSQSALLVPRDVSTNRPGGVNGMIRYNTSINALETFANGSWQLISAGPTVGTLQSLSTSTGLLGGPITTNGTLAVNAGTGAGQVVLEQTGGQILQSRGSLSAPAYGFVGASGIGMSIPTAGQLALSANGAPTLTLTSAGYIGIGTSLPLASLDITSVGTASAIVLPRDSSANRPSGVNGMLRYNNDLAALETFANGAWQSVSAGPTVGTVQSIATSTGLLGGPINSNGTISVNVGTGAGQIVAEQTGGQILQSSGSAGTPTYSFVGSTGSGVYSPGVNQIALTTAGTPSINILANGYVGINSTSPQGYLDVEGGTSTSGSGSSIILAAQNALSSGNGGNILLTPGLGAGSGTRGVVNAKGSIISTAFSPITATGAWLGFNLAGESGTWLVNQKGLGSGGIFMGISDVANNVTAQMSILQNGKVGIGTTAPVALLEVSGTGALSSIRLPQDTTLNRPTPASGMLRYNTTFSALETYASGSWQTLITSATATGIQTLTASTGLIGGTITTAGTISINQGTGAGQIVVEQTAGQILQSSGAASTPAFSFVGNSGSGLYSPAVGSVALAANGSSALTITSSGAVGIGTGAPAAPLHANVTSALFGPSATTGGAFVFNNLSANGYFGIYDTTNALLYGISRTLPAPAGASTLGGYYKGMGIGGASSNSNSAIFGVLNSGQNGFGVGSVAFTVSDSNKVSTFYSVLDDGTGKMGIGSATPQYTLDVAGDANLSNTSSFRIGGTAMCTAVGCRAISDRTLKMNVTPITNPLDKILLLNGIEFDFRDAHRFTGQHQIGVIAQDVERVFPEVVVTDSVSGLRSVAYEHLVAPLIESVKLIHHRVAALETLAGENKRLKERLTKTESQFSELKSYLCSKDPRAQICR